MGMIVHDEHERGRITSMRRGRWAAHLVGDTWYVWDLRGDDPWWLPEGKIDDASDLDAEVVLGRFLAIRGREEMGL